MPTKPATPCTQPGCPNRAEVGGKCRAHARERERQRGSAASRGYGAEWRRKRATYLAEHPWCVDCLAKGQYVPATEVDHVIPLSRGGADEPSNYAGRCKPHHSAKTMRESVGGGR